MEKNRKQIVPDDNSGFLADTLLNNLTVLKSCKYSLTGTWMHIHQRHTAIGEQTTIHGTPIQSTISSAYAAEFENPLYPKVIVTWGNLLNERNESPDEWARTDLSRDIGTVSSSIEDESFSTHLKDYYLNKINKIENKYAYKLYERLSLLDEVRAEEEGKSEGISVKSLITFYEFLNEYDLRFEIPQITLTDKGNIFAQWLYAPNKNLSIEFLGDRYLRFGVFFPAEKDTSKELFLSGVISIEQIDELFKIINLYNW